MELKVIKHTDGRVKITNPKTGKTLAERLLDDRGQLVWASDNAIVQLVCAELSDTMDQNALDDWLGWVQFLIDELRVQATKERRCSCVTH